MKAKPKAVVKLSPRHTQVLRMIALGHTTAEIADNLKISVKTADTHRTNMMKKLDLHRTADLTRYAIRIGLVSADE